MIKFNSEALKKNLSYKLQKGKKGLALTLASVALFSSLTMTAEAANMDMPDMTVYASSYASRVNVIGVEDRSINSGMVFPQVMEKIYDDGKNEYYLDCPKSNLIIVRYSNGTEKNVSQALNDGDIRVRTLRNVYGISIISSRKATVRKVIDKSSQYYVPQVMEKIYDDGKNEYYFRTQKSAYVIVRYSDGTEKNVVQALNDGDLTIKELQNEYGISVVTSKKPTIRSVKDNSTKPGVFTPQAYEKIYEDDKNEYYFTTMKSNLVIVRYSDGTEKNIIQALNDGDLTIKDLQNVYGISVVTQVRTNRISSVTDKSLELGISVPQVKEFIYSDGVNNYYLSTQRSTLVIVKYVDGTQKSVTQALYDGDLTIGDLQFTYNIPVTTERVNADNKYYDPSTLYKAPDGTYWTSKAEYEEWTASQKGYQYQYHK